tara:strand:- start:1139 stop:1972 length:834 start_codon:yes stop_codon:yes gene_type:complete
MDHYPINIGKSKKISIIGGINVLDDIDEAIEIGLKFKESCEKNKISYVFKASFDKANRTSFDSYRGPGFTKGLDMLREIKDILKVPILTDIHEAFQSSDAAEVCDMLQIPAFLARQTDLIQALANTGKPINIKKPQFVAPEQIKFIVQKFSKFGCEDVVICERGSMYGYNQQIVDIIGLEIVKEQTNKPVCVDITHSLQFRNEGGSASCGRRKYALNLAKAVTAISIDALFIEAHQKPDLAKCDGPSAIPSSVIPEFIDQVCEIDNLVKNQDNIQIK